MIEGRYELNWVTKAECVEQTLMRSDSAQELLRLRDLKRSESDHRTILWRVLDSEDYENDGVEWCEFCEDGIGFGGVPECERCKTIARLELWEVASG